MSQTRSVLAIIKVCVPVEAHWPFQGRRSLQPVSRFHRTRTLTLESSGDTKVHFSCNAPKPLTSETPAPNRTEQSVAWMIPPYRHRGPTIWFVPNATRIRVRGPCTSESGQIS